MKNLTAIGNLWLVMLSLLALNSHADIYTFENTQPTTEQLQRIKNDASQPVDSFYQLYEQHRITVNSQTAKVRSLFIERFHLANDIQDYGQQSISFQPETDQLHILRAAAVAPDGTVTLATPEDIKVIDTNQYNTFSSQKEVLVNIPSISQGGYTIFEYIVTTNKQKLEADWIKRYYPQTLTAKKHYELSATWGEDYAPNLFVESEAVTCTSTPLSIHCQGTDIPALQRDPDVNWYDEIGFIHIADHNSWQDVAKQYQQVFTSALSHSDEDLLGQINLPSNASLEQNINHIHQFVAQNIRYLSRSEYGHAITPHKTTQTLSKRQGDCKDKSALLVDLLQRIGVNAYPVLVNTRRKKLRETMAPSLAQFNHVLVCFDLPNNQQKRPYCIDATDIDTPWQHISSWVQGRLALPLSTGKLGLMASDTYRWQFKVDTQLKFLTDGGQSEKQIRTYLGPYAAWLKNYINDTQSEEVHNWLVDNYHENVSNQAEPEFTFQGQSQMSDDVTISSSVQYPPFIDVGEALDYSENDNWLINEIDNNKLENKYYDEFFAGLNLHSTVNIDLNKMWALTVPPAELKLHHDYGSVTRTSQEQNGNVIVTTELEMPSRWVKAEDIKAFNAFLKIIRKELKININGKALTKKSNKKT